MKRLIIAFLFLAILSVASPSSTAEPAKPAPTYAKDVQPFFKKYCVDCHNASERKAGVNLETYETMMRSGKKGRNILPGDPDHSRVISSLEGRSKKMPPRKYADQPTRSEIELVRAWIAAGAKKNQ
jgi:uncharacterized membrane protein